jgi:hypothetical protein
MLALGHITIPYRSLQVLLLNFFKGDYHSMPGVVSGHQFSLQTPESVMHNGVEPFKLDLTPILTGKLMPRSNPSATSSSPSMLP